jgi:hypothetical protein
VVTYARAPVISTDSYRYLWDGRVTNEGINPYLYPPSAPELRHLRNANWRPLAYKHVPTVYPPGAEALFAGLARIRHTDRAAFLWAFLLLDTGSVLVIAALLRRTGRPPEQVIWYAWSPLVVTEVAAGGHVDAAGVFCLLVALLLMTQREQAGVKGALAYAGSVLMKGPSAIAFPVFAARGGRGFAAAVAVAVIAVSAPFVGAGPRLFSGVVSYLGYWQTNAGLFRLLTWALEKTDPLHVPRLLDGTPNYIPVVRPFTTLLLFAFVAVVTSHYRRRPTIERLVAAVFGTLGMQLLLGAPVLPWYVMWTVPALCWWSIPGWLVFTFTVSATYYLRWITPRELHDPLLWATYVPVYALLVWQWVWWRRTALGRGRPASGG